MPPPADNRSRSSAEVGLLAAIATSYGVERHVYRLASLKADEDFLRELGLDEDGQLELMELLAQSGYRTSPESLCAEPFARKRRRRWKTRFSDGSFPVFYGSLEAETAEAEVAYWFKASFAGSPVRRRRAFYQRFSCSFEGSEKDLRHKSSEWPELTHESDYAFCNRLGAEAVRLGLDALVAPSARRQGGSNLPVFSRSSITAPRDEALVSVTLEPATGEVIIGSGTPPASLDQRPIQ